MRTDDPALSPGNPTGLWTRPVSDVPRGPSYIKVTPYSRPSHKRHGTKKATPNSMATARTFGAEERIPPALQLPTDEFVLCAFAASGAGVHAGSTARNNIAALKAWHIAQGQPWKGGSRLHYVLAGVENMAPESSKRPPRPPINAKMLKVLHEGLDFASPRDEHYYPLPTTTRHYFTSPLAITCRALVATQNQPFYVSPEQKRKKSGDDVVLVPQRTPLDPQIALYMHLQVNKLPASAPLFAYRTATGVENLTRPKFLQRCNEIWQAVGYPRTTGHSFRIGGTTELLLAGVAPDVVKAMGRWSSDAFHRYWRSLEDLAPLHAAHISS
ncbi:hypothetical protein C8R46DRAFT_1362275 [Mycena filopes]|nr:hypothetical protein C8R46DRAFT_1362275 [Mycena filopes]